MLAELHVDVVCMPVAAQPSSARWCPCGVSPMIGAALRSPRRCLPPSCDHSRRGSTSSTATLEGKTGTFPRGTPGTRRAPQSRSRPSRRRA
eukprot:8719546-Pyramimonas_sp.AAC.1